VEIITISLYQIFLILIKRETFVKDFRKVDDNKKENNGAAGCIDNTD